MIKLITGPMFSGKSSRLVELLMKEPSPNHYCYLFIRPPIDDRGFITRDRDMERRFANTRHNIDHQVAASFADLLQFDLSMYKAIYIDELHLVDASDGSDVHSFLKKVIASKINLVVAGLNGSSEQRNFEAVSRFLPYVSDIEFLKARCCNDEGDGQHDEAVYTVWRGRKTKKNLIEVGDQDYSACCAKCLNL